MPNGFPRALANQYPNEKPPSWFHPASPKIKAVKPEKNEETASMASTSTFASTVGLLKDSVKNKFFHKEHRAPTVTEQDVKTAREPQQLPKYDSRRETTAAFEYLASVK